MSAQPNRLAEFCARAPDLKVALTEFLDAEINDIAHNMITAQEDRDLVRAQGGARSLKALRNKVDKW